MEQVEHAKMKTITKMIVKSWLIVGDLMALFFIFSPKEQFGRYFSGVVVCYCIISFFVNRMDQRYWPERNVSQISKVITIIMIAGMLVKCFWIN